MCCVVCDDGIWHSLLVARRCLAILGFSLLRVDVGALLFQCLVIYLALRSSFPASQSLEVTVLQLFLWVWTGGGSGAINLYGGGRNMLSILYVHYTPGYHSRVSLLWKYGSNV